LLAGCGNADTKKFKDELAGCGNVDTKKFKDDLVSLIEGFGEPKDEATAWENQSEIYGEGNFVFVTKGEDGIGVCKCYDNKAVLFEIYIDSITVNYINIWNVIITYYDFNNKIYIALDYYDTSLWTGNFKVYRLHYNIEDAIKYLRKLTIEDYEYILDKLGY
jgi:hypothetical protein